MGYRAATTPTPSADGSTSSLFRLGTRTVHQLVIVANQSRHHSSACWQAMTPNLDVTQFDVPSSGQGPLIVDADHPSLDAEHDRFFEALRSEPRYFGPSASTNPKPYP